MQRSRNSIYTLIPQSYSPFSASAYTCGKWRSYSWFLVACENQGVFFLKDSYLVLHHGQEERSHLHLRIGQQPSLGEQGAFIVLPVPFNTLLWEQPGQHQKV